MSRISADHFCNFFRGIVTRRSAGLSRYRNVALLPSKAAQAMLSVLWLMRRNAAAHAHEFA
jgi:hypothetical protein